MNGEVESEESAENAEAENALWPVMRSPPERMWPGLHSQTGKEKKSYFDDTPSVITIRYAKYC